MLSPWSSKLQHCSPKATTVYEATTTNAIHLKRPPPTLSICSHHHQCYSPKAVTAIHLKLETPTIFPEATAILSTRSRAIPPKPPPLLLSTQSHKRYSLTNKIRRLVFWKKKLSAFTHTHHDSIPLKPPIEHSLRRRPGLCHTMRRVKGGEWE